MFGDAFEALLRRHCTGAHVREVEAGGSPEPLWAAISSSGFLDLLASEEAGGAALPLRDFYPLAAQLGRFAVPAPVGESIVARALVEPGSPCLSGRVTLATGVLRRADGTVACPLVPFGAIATHVLASEGRRLLVLEVAHAERIPTGVNRSLAATLVWPAGAACATLEARGEDATAFAAALHAALLAGAAQRAFDMTLAYCNDRVQFGRSLGKFQAVQHQLAEMAEQVAAASAAAEAAFVTPGPAPALLAAALAKARASEAAARIADLAHGLHGAIGVTEAYDLQLFTRRLHEGRTAHGAETYWHRFIGDLLLQSDRSVADFVRAA